MSSILVTAFMLALCTVLFATRRYRADHSLLFAASFISVSSASNIDAIFGALDSLIGARNIAFVLGDAALLVGVYFLSRGIVRAVRGISHHSRTLAMSLPIAVLFSIGAFAAIGDTSTSTTFMLDYGHRPAAAIYSMIVFGYIGAAMVLAFRACVSTFRALSGRAFRLGIGLIALGASAALVMVLSVWALDVVHVISGTVPRALSSVFDASYLAAMTLLSVGLAVPGVAKWRIARKISKNTRELADLHRKALEQNDGFYSLVSRHAASAGPASVLHRMVVDIEDASHSGAKLSATDLDRLRRAQNVLRAGEL